jgi:hypothetical protein
MLRVLIVQLLHTGCLEASEVHEARPSFPQATENVLKVAKSERKHMSAFYGATGNQDKMTSPFFRFDKPTITFCTEPYRWLNYLSEHVT